MIVLFIIFIAFLLVWIIADFTVIPNIYGEDVSFLNWLFTNPMKIIDTLKDSAAVLPGTDNMTRRLVPLLMKIWVIGFTTVLYFLCRQFHIKAEEKNINALFSDKEPYLMIQDISTALKRMRKYENCKEWNALIYSVKCQEERLSTESDFGYGNDKVIKCENDIYQQFQCLLDTVQNVGNDDFRENVSALHIVIKDIDYLLQKRTELKRR